MKLKLIGKMKLVTKLFAFILSSSFVLMLGCKNKKNVPDVSHIKVQLSINRFEQDFFKADTNNLSSSFDKIGEKYNQFLPDYLFQILGLQPHLDSTIKEAKLFLKDSIYNAIYKESQQQFKNMDDEKAELTKALQLTKYYFPSYNLPSNLTTFVGPLDGYGCVLTSYGTLAVGLQGFLGKSFELYTNGYIAQTYPSYKTRRFERQYIATSCISNIINEIYPTQSTGKPLVERFVELGKKHYVLDALLPYTHDTVKTGYTQAQLTGCIKNEKVIWGYFVQNNLLYEREPSLINPYLNDGPKTPEISDAAPGNIGLFVGWQIVKQYMEKNKTKTLQQLLATPAKTIFTEVAYAP